MLLGSPPDMVRGHPLRETGSAAAHGGLLWFIYFTICLGNYQLKFFIVSEFLYFKIFCGFKKIILYNPKIYGIITEVIFPSVSAVLRSKNKCGKRADAVSLPSNHKRKICEKPSIYTGFGPVAQLGVQAGRLYAPRFGGVTRMVATRFTSHKRKFYKMRHVTRVPSIWAISSAGRAQRSQR